MELNKILSLIIGFIVVILLFILIARQFRDNQQVGNVVISPIPTVLSPSPTPTGTSNGLFSWVPWGRVTGTQTTNKNITSTTPIKKQVTKIQVYKTTSPTPSQLSFKGDISQQQQKQEEVVNTQKNKTTQYNKYKAVESSSQRQKQVVIPSEIPQTGPATIWTLLTILGVVGGATLRKIS